MTNDVTFHTNIPSEYRKQEEKKRLCQGDIFQDFSFSTYLGVSDPILEGSSEKITEVYSIVLPHFVVLSQDCDLETDYNARFNSGESTRTDKMVSVLVCPIYNSTQLRSGSHLDNIDRKTLNSKQWDQIKIHNHERYHLLPSSEIEIDSEAMVIDFKDYYTIPTELLYDHMHSYKFTLEELFRERLSQRFSNYLSRIGLPSIIRDPKPELTSILPAATPSTAVSG